VSTSQTVLFVPPTRAKATDDKGFLSKPYQQYLFTLQYLLPLIKVDTTSGPLTQAVPPAGLNSTTGQSNQNMEITYTKVSADGNVFTLTGVEGGPYMLVAMFDVIKIKSDGTNWWPVG
jgi:hypothetical protein